jgi:hypothetical protein
LPEAIENRGHVSQEARDDAIRRKENAIMRTLLFATAAITVLAVAAPAFARAHFRDYGYYGEYGNGYVMRDRAPRADKTSRLHPRHVVPKPTQAYEPYYLDPEGYRGYVPNNWGSFCGQLAKAC